jgi:hypothetical protein
MRAFPPGGQRPNSSRLPTSSEMTAWHTANPETRRSCAAAASLMEDRGPPVIGEQLPKACGGGKATITSPRSSSHMSIVQTTRPLPGDRASSTGRGEAGIARYQAGAEAAAQYPGKGGAFGNDREAMLKLEVTVRRRRMR